MTLLVVYRDVLQRGNYARPPGIASPGRVVGGAAAIWMFRKT